MELTNSLNDRRRVDGQTQRNRDAEVARMRRAGVSYRAIASGLDMSLGAVQKSLRRAQKLADAMAGGEPGDVVAMVCDDELKCADVQTPEDVERLSELERWRLRHLDTPMGRAERERPWPTTPAPAQRTDGPVVHVECTPPDQRFRNGL